MLQKYDRKKRNINRVKALGLFIVGIYSKFDRCTFNFTLSVLRVRIHVSFVVFFFRFHAEFSQTDSQDGKKRSKYFNPFFIL